MRTNRKARGCAAFILAALLGASPLAGQEMKKPMGAMPGMSGTMSTNRMMSRNIPMVPPVTGYAEGQEILFLHTEASDPRIARILTDMMGSPVLVVPSLAKAPSEMLAPVYVFTNGKKPDGAMGPLGFQPDVFPNPPGQIEYTPLRKIVLVTWKDAAAARVLRSAAEVRDAINSGQATVEEPGVIVNMPMLTWPGGQR